MQPPTAALALGGGHFARDCVVAEPPNANAILLYGHSKRHPENIQTSMTLPTRPHAIFSTLQGAQTDTQKPTSQKSLPCANTKPTHPSGRNFYRLYLNTSANNYAQH